MSGEKCPKCGGSLLGAAGYWECTACKHCVPYPTEADDLRCQLAAEKAAREKAEADLAELRKGPVMYDGVVLLGRQMFDDMTNREKELRQQRDEARAACADLRELVRDAFSEGQRTAPTDLDRGRRWEESDAYDDLAKSTLGQPLLDELTALKEQVEELEYAYKASDENRAFQCARAERAEAACAVMAREIETWNASVAAIIGRQPVTGIDVPKCAREMLDELTAIRKFKADAQHARQKAFDEGVWGPADNAAEEPAP